MCHLEQYIDICQYSRVSKSQLDPDARRDRGLLLAPGERAPRRRTRRGASPRCSRPWPTRCGSDSSRWSPPTPTARPASATSTTPSTCPSRRSATTSRCCTRRACSTRSKRGVVGLLPRRPGRARRPDHAARRRHPVTETTSTPAPVRRLGTLDRFLPVWIGLAMVGRAAPGPRGARPGRRPVVDRGRRHLAADRDRAAGDDVPGAGQGPLRPARQRHGRPAAARLLAGAQLAGRPGADVHPGLAAAAGPARRTAPA